MKAIAICGSPRKEGNTEKLLEKCLARISEEGIETELVRTAGKTIKTCTACTRCREIKDGTCVIKDDDFHEVFDKMKESDIIIAGSPVYFGSATPETMALLDRAGYVSRGNGQLFSRKIGGPVAVARHAGQNFTYGQLMYWFTINDMIVPGSTYWNIGFGGARGEILEDTEALKTIERFADNIVWLSKKII